MINNERKRKRKRKNSGNKKYANTVRKQVMMRKKMRTVHLALIIASLSTDVTLTRTTFKRLI